MRNRYSLIASLALALGAATSLNLVAFTDAPAAEGKQTVSKALAKPLKAAQDALQAKKYAEAVSKLQEAQATGGRSAFDDFTINEMLGFAYVRMGNYGEAAKALEASFNSGLLPQGDQATRIRALSQINYQIKNYDKAIDFGNRAIKGGFADADIYTLVGQAYYVKGDYKGTLRFMNNYLDDIEKRGQTPKEQTLQIVMSSCVKLEDDACTTRALERLVSNYPKKDYWQNLLYSLFRAPDNNDKALLNIYRLASEVDILKRSDDYTEMAQLSIEAGSPGEAQKILEKGFANNVFTDARDKDKNQRLLESAKKQAAVDKAQLGKLEASTSANKVGDPDVKLGLAYLSYDQYDKAVAAIQRGIGKGGVKNPEEAQLLLGIAQLKLKKKDDALKAFKSVKTDPKLARLANLWALHAQQT